MKKIYIAILMFFIIISLNFKAGELESLQNTIKYPFVAEKLNVEGETVVGIFINEDGTVNNVYVIKKGGYGFDEEAILAIKNYTFNPTVKDGTKVVSHRVLKVVYKLN